jgi:hypothetical protein
MFKVNDMVTVRTTQGVQSVRVLAVKHPVSEGQYILNDVITVQFLGGEKGMFYYKDLTQTGNEIPWGTPLKRC